MMDITDIMDSILSKLPKKQPPGNGNEEKHKPKTEYNGEPVSIDTATSKKLISHFLDKLPVKIGKGSRYDTSLSYAGLLWACGYPQDEIKTKLVKFNKERNNPPKTDTEDIDKIISFIVTLPQGFRERKKNEVAPDMTKTEPLIELEAKNIYESGKFTEYALKTFEKVWYKDQHIFRWLMAVFANNFVENTKEGLHLYVCGPSGLGKSESVKVFLNAVPEEYLISGSFSKMSILYTDGALPGSLIFQDDHIPTDDEAEVIRAILSSWSTGFTHNTVERMEGKNTRVPKNIPKRLTKILTNADAISRTSSNGQDESRYVCIEFKRSKDEMRKIIAFDDEPPNIEQEIKVIKAIWRHIAKNPRTIAIPYKIKVNDAGVFKVREFKRFKTLLKSLVLLDNRTEATPDDFTRAIELWKYILVMIDNESAGAKTPEQQVLDKLVELAKTDADNEVKLSELMRALPAMKQPNIYRYLRGRNGTFENATGGILTMVPGIMVKEMYNKDTQTRERIIRMPCNVATGFQSDVYYIADIG